MVIGPVSQSEGKFYLLSQVPNIYDGFIGKEDICHTSDSYFPKYRYYALKLFFIF